MVELRDIHKTYTIGTNTLKVLKGIDMSVKPGEFVSVMGSSGSGKSTLLNIVGLLDRQDHGEYHLDGRRIEKLSEARCARLRSQFIGFVFQSFNLIPFKTAAENVALPLYYRNVPRRKRNTLALEYLDRVGLQEWADHHPTELSGGQQQRVAIARALIARPKVILADEPTGALDSATSYEVVKLLRSISDTGVSVIVVTHEHDIAEMTDRVVHLRDGTIENGSVEAAHA